MNILVCTVVRKMGNHSAPQLDKSIYFSTKDTILTTFNEDDLMLRGEFPILKTGHIVNAQIEDVDKIGGNHIDGTRSVKKMGE